MCLTSGNFLDDSFNKWCLEPTSKLISKYKIKIVDNKNQKSSCANTSNECVQAIGVCCVMFVWYVLIHSYVQKRCILPYSNGTHSNIVSLKKKHVQQESMGHIQRRKTYWIRFCAQTIHFPKSLLHRRDFCFRRVSLLFSFFSFTSWHSYTCAQHSIRCRPLSCRWIGFLNLFGGSHIFPFFFLHIKFNRYTWFTIYTIGTFIITLRDSFYWRGNICERRMIFNGSIQ